MLTFEHHECMIHVDVEATQAAYALLKYRSPSDECSCSGCKNFTEAMPTLFTPDIVAWFSSLGINHNQPGEVYHYNREENGLHLYGGWYHGIGTLEGPCVEGIKLSENFRISISPDAVCLHEPFVGKPVFQIDITVSIPWVIPEQELD